MRQRKHVSGAWGAVLGLWLSLNVACDSLSDPGGGVCRCPPPNNFAALALGCVPAKPPNVTTTGPCIACAPFGSNAPTTAGIHCEMGPDSDRIELMSDGAGTCHVAVTFADGTTASRDIDFTAVPRPCGSNPRGCGEAFVAVTPDGGAGLLSLPAPDCQTGS